MAVCNHQIGKKGYLIKWLWPEAEQVRGAASNSALPNFPLTYSTMGNNDIFSEASFVCFLKLNVSLDKVERKNCLFFFFKLKWDGRPVSTVALKQFEGGVCPLGSQRRAGAGVWDVESTADPEPHIPCLANWASGLAGVSQNSCGPCPGTKHRIDSCYVAHGTGSGSSNIEVTPACRIVSVTLHRSQMWAGKTFLPVQLPALKVLESLRETQRKKGNWIAAYGNMSSVLMTFKHHLLPAQEQPRQGSRGNLSTCINT